MDRAIKLDSNNSVSYYNRGLCYSKEGNVNLAIDDYRKAISLNPSFADVYLQLARIYYKNTNQYDEAITVITQGIKLEQNLCELYTVRAGVYHKLGNQSKAIDDYNEAIKYFNKSYVEYYNPFYNLGCLYYEIKDYEQAIKYLSLAIESDSTDGEFYFTRGKCYQAQNKTDKANKDLAKAAELGYAEADSK